MVKANIPLGSIPLWGIAKQSVRSPKVAALFSATNFSSYIIELLQLHDTIQIKLDRSDDAIV